jgi:hypothetical protein
MIVKREQILTVVGCDLDRTSVRVRKIDRFVERIRVQRQIARLEHSSIRLAICVGA